MPRSVFDSGATFLLVCAGHQGRSKKKFRVFINERFQIWIWGLFFVVFYIQTTHSIFPTIHLIIEILQETCHNEY